MKLHSGLSGLLYYRDNNYFTFVIYQIFVINFNKAMRPSTWGRLNPARWRLFCPI